MQAQNSGAEQSSPWPLLLYPLDQPSSYYGAVFSRGKELWDKVDLAVRGFTVNESNVPQGTAAAGRR